jgi:hypothetical protein
MTPSRRTFVSGMMVGLPALAYATGRAQPSRPAVDPVFAQIQADLRRIYEEIRRNPRRTDSLRAFESTLRMHAAHSTGLGNDQRVKKLLADTIDAGQRGELVREAVRQGHREHRAAELRRMFGRFDPAMLGRDLTEDEIETGIDKVLVGGHTSALIAAADLVRRKAEEAVQQANVRVVRVQSGCEIWQNQTEMMGVLAGLVCALTLLYPVLAVECAALGATWATMELLGIIFC